MKVEFDLFGQKYSATYNNGKMVVSPRDMNVQFQIDFAFIKAESSSKYYFNTQYMMTEVCRSIGGECGPVKIDQSNGVIF